MKQNPTREASSETERWVERLTIAKASVGEMLR